MPGEAGRVGVRVGRVWMGSEAQNQGSSPAKCVWVVGGKHGLMVRGNVDF